MFVEVNSIKTLIIDIKPNSSLEDWVNISNEYSCLFLISCEEEMRLLKSSVSNNSKFFLKKGTFPIKKSIYEAVRASNLYPYEIAFVTTDFNIVDKLLGETFGTILLSNKFTYDQIGRMPDIYAGTPDDLLHTLKNFPGYFGELFNTISADQSYNTSGKIFSFPFKYENYTFNVISLGRYYNPKHHRFRKHQLSHRIRKSKSDRTQDNMFINSFFPVINLREYDGITRVPPRPSDIEDRLASIVGRLSSKIGTSDFTTSLSCKGNFPKQKDQSNKDQRLINVKNRFTATHDIVGKNIVLIDDVFTTGATVGECAATLIEKGAKEVTIIVMAVNQFDLDQIFSPERKDLYCPKQCGGKMVLRIPKTGLGAFWGCSNFSNNTCNKTIPFYDGWRRMNRLNVIENEFDSDEDILF